MKTVEQIRKQLLSGDFEFSRHAFRRAVERNISEAEIYQVGERATIIEAYPTDKYSPSCLLLGYTISGRVLHLQVSQADTVMVRILPFMNLTRRHGMKVLVNGGRDVCM